MLPDVFLTDLQGKFHNLSPTHCFHFLLYFYSAGGVYSQFFKVTPKDGFVISQMYF